MLYSKTIQVKYEADVFVAGGGAAGVAAAIAAARGGRKVFLAEAQGAFGGLGTTGLVPAFAPFGDGEHVLAAGIGYEIRKSVSKNIPLDAYWCPIRCEELKLAYDRAIEQAGVTFSFFTQVIDVSVHSGHISHVILSAKSGIFAVKAKIYIDCTGDGDLCAMAGADFSKGDEEGDVMPPTLCSLWANIDFSKAGSCSKEEALEKAISDGVFTYPDLHLPGFFKPDEARGIGGGNIGHIFGVDPLDEVSVTKAMVWGRKLLKEYETFYKKYMAGFEDMYEVVTANMLGVRESRRIVCDYTLTGEDFIKRASFADEVGRYCYPVDIHAKSTDKAAHEAFLKEYKEKMRYQKGESYGIPYRSLLPARLSNVLVAGRCIGTDRSMQASLRVMPGCFITGQAAGAAAAIAAATEDTRSVSPTALQKSLVALGAYLPNANSD